MLSSHRFVQHRVRAMVALLALTLAALVLPACGGGGDGGNGSSSDAQTLLTQTFTGRHQIRSGNANVVLEVDVRGDPSLRGPIELRISGPFQSAGADALPKFDMTLDARAQGQGIKAGLTSTSDHLYVRFGGTSYAVPDELMSQLKDGYARAQREGSSQQQMSLAGLGIDPMGWLKDPQVEGTDTVGGTETDHITAELDEGALLDDVDTLLHKAKEQGLGAAAGRQVPDRLPEDTRKQIEDAVKSGTVDVWTGKADHTLRRLAVALHIEPQSSGDGPDAVDVALTITLGDVNEPQTIEAPATTRPLSELLGQVQGLLGGALGGGSAFGGSSGAGGGATQEQLDAYARCIEDAGSDVAEAQQCASLLTK